MCGLRGPDSQSAATMPAGLLRVPLSCALVATDNFALGLERPHYVRAWMTPHSVQTDTIVFYRALDYGAFAKSGRLPEVAFDFRIHGGEHARSDALGVQFAVLTTSVDGLPSSGAGGEIRVLLESLVAAATAGAEFVVEMPMPITALLDQGAAAKDADAALAQTAKVGVRIRVGAAHELHRVRFRPDLGIEEYHPDNDALHTRMVSCAIDQQLAPILEQSIQASGAGDGQQVVTSFGYKSVRNHWFSFEPISPTLRGFCSPVYMYGSGYLPGHAFHYPLPRRPPPAAFYQNMVDVALDRANRSRAWLVGAVASQLAVARASAGRALAGGGLSRPFVEAVRAYGVFAVALTTSMSYTADEVYRKQRRGDKLPPAAHGLPDAHNELHNRPVRAASYVRQPVEMYSQALVSGTGDCEDFARNITTTVLFDFVARDWAGADASLRAMHDIGRLYVAATQLGSVTNRSLVEQKQLEHNHATLEHALQIGSPADQQVDVGGHMFAESYPRRHVVLMTQRVLPKADADLYAGALADPATDALQPHLPVLVHEGTGRLSPWLRPDASYGSDAEHRRLLWIRHSARAAAQAHLSDGAKLVGSAVSFEHQAETRVSAANRRVRTFYRDTTFMFAPYLEKLGLPSSYFYWISTHRRVPDTPQALFGTAAYDRLHAETVAARPRGTKWYHGVCMRDRVYATSGGDPLPWVALHPTPPLTRAQNEMIAARQIQMAPEIDVAAVVPNEFYDSDSGGAAVGERVPAADLAAQLAGLLRAGGVPAYDRSRTLDADIEHEVAGIVHDRLVHVSMFLNPEVMRGAYVGVDVAKVGALLAADLKGKAACASVVVESYMAEHIVSFRIDVLARIPESISIT